DHCFRITPQTKTRTHSKLLSVVSTARCRWGCVERQSNMEQPYLKRKRERDEPPAPKRHKPDPPKHGQRLFFKANLFWHDQAGRREGRRVTLLLDCGCTGPILNKDFVDKVRMPWIQRDQPITVQTADGKPMEGAGERHTQ